MAKTTITFKDNSSKVLETERNAVFAALTKIGIAAKAHARANIKEKDVYDTGELYRTMGYRTDTDKGVVYIGSPKNYAVFNELGTVKMPARPFLQPAVLDNIHEYKQITADVLGKEFASLMRSSGLGTKSEYYQEDSRVNHPTAKAGGL